MARRSNEPPKVTILLDYAACSPFDNWITAFGNHHPHLGLAMLIYLVCSVALVPLTSGLFIAAQTHDFNKIYVKSTMDAMFSTATLNTQTDLQPSIDLSSAIHGYGARIPAWMTSEYSIRPYSPVKKSEIGDITAETQAYHTEPKCHVVLPEDITIEGGVNSAVGVGTISTSFSDRGCDVGGDNELSWQIASDIHSYSFTWYQQCSGSYQLDERVGIFAALYSASEPHQVGNISMISCKPEYFNTTADVMMSFDGSGAKGIVSIDYKTPMPFTSISLRTLVANLPLYRLQGVSGSIKNDMFGDAVYSCAKVLDPDSVFRSGNYLKATETVYQTMFAALTSNELMVPQSTVRVYDSRLATPSTHLYVSVPITAVLSALLLAMIICTLVLIIYAAKTTSILTEEPIGLLGKALILWRSDVTTFAEKVRADHPPGENLIGIVKKEYTVESSSCWYEDKSETGKGRIPRRGS